MIAWLLIASGAWAACPVTSSANAGPGSLRSALNNCPANDTITFTVASVNLSTELPTITTPGLTLDGAGAVQIDGVSLASGNGLTVDADGVTIRGLHLGRFPGAGIEVLGGAGVTLGGSGLDANALTQNGEAGIRVSGGSQALVDGNRVGLRFDDSAAGNCQTSSPCAGIEVMAAATLAAVTGNIIGANKGDGLRVHSAGAMITSNLVGLSASGVLDRGNTGHGILVSGTPLQPASQAAIRYNLVAGNGGNGIHLAAFAGSADLQANGVGLDIFDQPVGNDGHGIVLGSIGNTVHGVFTTPTVVAANGRTGILVQGLGNTVVDTLVGVAPGDTSGSLGNGEYGIRLVAPQTTLGALGEPLVVSGNHLGGVWIDAANVGLTHSLVGLSDDGLAAVPNGTDPSGPSSDVFGGVWVTAGVGPSDTPPWVTDASIAGNQGHGVWVYGALHDDDTQGVRIERNDVGLAGDGTAAANVGDGVRVEGAALVEVVDNTIAGNTGAGVRLAATGTRATLAAEVRANLIGDPTDSFGNGGTGVLLDGGAGSAGVLTNWIGDNTIHHSGEYGVYSANGAWRNEITANTFYDNARCLVADDDLSNLGRAWPTPEVVSVSGGVVELSLGMVVGFDSLDRIEVYVGTGGDAVYDGNAVVDQASGTYKLMGSVATSVAEVRGLAISAQGNTSSMSLLDGDGCQRVPCAQLDPLPTDQCTFTYWNGAACVEHTRPDGYPCDDGDVNTGISRFGQPFDYVPGYTGDAPDHCLAGVCQGGTPTTDPMDCPFATNCNIAVRDATLNQCTYSADCANNACEVDNLGNNGSCDGCGLLGCNQFAMDYVGAPLNPDGDLVPDDWERYDDTLGHQRDWNCDGTMDADYPEGGSATERNAYLYIAWMSEWCPQPPYSDAQLVGVHHHRPDQQVLAEMEQLFFDGGRDSDAGLPIALTITEQCIPHYTQMSGDYRNNFDPDCDELHDHVSIRDLKAWYFAPWRRGIYSFAVMGHGYPEHPGGDEGITWEQQTDGLCISDYNKTGEGEIFGDDLRVMHQKMHDPDDPNLPEPDRVAETSTLLHEFGHNLGLRHGGHEDLNNKPNYQSRMNYTYGSTMAHESNVQIRDFSHIEEPSLDETHIDEVGPGVFTSTMPVGDRRYLEWECTGRCNPRPLPDGGPIDFTGDGVLDTNLPYDVNQDGSLDTGLAGHDDFNALRLDKYCADDADWDDDRIADENNSPFGSPSGFAEVAVDLAPGCTTNEVPLDDIAPIQLVLYGSASLDVATLRPSWFSLAGASPRRLTRADVDQDGHDDVRLWFRASDMPLLRSASQNLVFNARSDDHVLYVAAPAAAPGMWGDADADQVIDPCDACPGTAPDTTVDVTGCP